MKISQRKQKEFKKKLIELLQAQGYSVITGKGSFKQGACLVLQDKKIVLNNFLPLDLQIKFLIEIFESESLETLVPSEISKFVEQIS